MLAHSAARAETKRPDIERAALQLFVTRGLRGTTVRDIAARAGVAEGTLYRHWRSKRELARTLFRGCAAAVAGDLRRAVRAERTPRERLTAAIRALFRSARDEVLLYEMLILPPSHETQDFIADAESPAEVLADVVADGQRRREFADVDPRLAAECIIGAVNRVAIHRRLGTLPRRLTQYEHDLVAIVLSSLAVGRRGRTA